MATLNIYGTIQNASAYGLADAWIDLHIQDGTAPYKAEIKFNGVVYRTIDNADPHTEIHDLPVGMYQIHVSDSSDPVEDAYADNGFDAVSPPYATLSGVVNPGGELTTITFKYGLTTDYGFTLDGGKINGTAPVPVTMRLACGGYSPGTQLLPNTTYHSQLVAVNSMGTVDSPDVTFVTPSYLPQILSFEVKDIS